MNDKTMEPYIRVDNLREALKWAIESRAAYEKALNFSGKSALLQGWLDVLEATKRGELPVVTT
jgi:hypothetical protein